MAKEPRIQKKKTATTVALDILFKTLVAIAIIIICIIAYDKIDFSTKGFDIKSGRSSAQAPVPSELKWFDDFKGVENVPDKNSKKSNSSGGSQNFLQYESQKNR